jgi:5-hydroxyisourate hydrolase
MALPAVDHHAVANRLPSNRAPELISRCGRYREFGVKLGDSKPIGDRLRMVGSVGAAGVPVGSNGSAREGQVTPMSVHVEVVDSMFSRPAAGVPVRLLRESGDSWQEESAVRTDETSGSAELATTTHRSRYRVVVSLDEYFAGLGVEPFQSRVDVTFRVGRPNEGVRLLMMISPSACVTCSVTAGNA